MLTAIPSLSLLTFQKLFFQRSDHQSFRVLYEKVSNCSFRRSKEVLVSFNEPGFILSNVLSGNGIEDCPDEFWLIELELDPVCMDLIDEA